MLDQKGHCYYFYTQGFNTTCRWQVIGSKAIMDSVVAILDSKIDQKEKNTKLRAILKRDRMADVQLSAYADMYKQGIKSDLECLKPHGFFVNTSSINKI